MSNRNILRAAILLTLIIFATVARLQGQKPPVASSVPTIRTEVDLLSIAVRVTDRKDNEIHGLTADQFSLYENGVQQKISFFDAEDEPVSLGILLDVSGSMEASGKLDRAKDALSRLLTTMRPDDEMFYLRFHRRVDKIVDFTSDPHAILSAISATRAMQDGTSLYDAIAKALCYMQKARHHKRALLVVTDGADEHSHRSLDNLIPIVQASQAQVFILGCFSKEEYDFYRSAHAQKLALVTNQEIDNPLVAFKRLADESGAESFFPSPDKLQDAVDAVAHLLRTQYTLAYYPSSTAGGFRQIEVKVAQSGARVRARRGFGGVEPAVSGGPSGPAAGCENEQLKPYPYEAKVTIKNGLTLYHDDFQDKASGWPSRENFHYGDGTYEIRVKHVSHSDSIGAGQYSMTGLLGYVAIGDLETGGTAAGLLVANGPWFNDLNASVSVELKSSGDVGDIATAAGLVFRLNARGYYAVIVSKDAPGSRGLAFKLVKKYHYEKTTRDLLPWTPVPLSHLMPGQQEKVAVQCRGDVITILLPGLPETKYEDRSYGSFSGGLVGMVLYGVGGAVFRDLSAEEVGEAGQVPPLSPQPSPH
jgi:Ca-activated chloride channel family protein